jgi:hypothetical protein
MKSPTASKPVSAESRMTRHGSSVRIAPEARDEVVRYKKRAREEAERKQRAEKRAARLQEWLDSTTLPYEDLSKNRK